MAILGAHALHSSCSYGENTPEPFAEIVKGDVPTAGEKVSVCQGRTEMHAASINRESADDLATELGMTRAALGARCQELCRAAMGAHAFPATLPRPLKLRGDTCARRSEQDQDQNEI